MTGVFILGAGGHAKVVADILLCQGLKITGFFDDNPDIWNAIVLGIPVLGPNSSYADRAPGGMVIGIGSNAVRQKLAIQFDGSATWINAVHPGVVIANSVKLGTGVVMAAGTIVNPDSIIGDHVIINTGATVDHDCTIGSFCHIAPGSHLGGGVEVGEGTLIGIGATVLPYCKIGRGVTIGGGAVVVNDIPDHSTVKGIPAR